MTEAHKVKITYCAECGYEPQALDLTKALMYEFGPRLSAIEIIPFDRLELRIGNVQWIHALGVCRSGDEPSRSSDDRSKRLMRTHRYRLRVRLLSGFGRDQLPIGITR